LASISSQPETYFYTVTGIWEAADKLVNLNRTYWWLSETFQGFKTGFKKCFITTAAPA
jgi:hypothetical protein